MAVTTERKASNIRSIPRLGRRKRDAHKGDFGRVLIVGGSCGMLGAPALAASAALRAGAGLVKMALPRCIQIASASLEPCATSMSLPDTSAGTFAPSASDKVIAAAEAHDVVALGPGLNTSPTLARLVGAILAIPEKRVVLDADGLNNLARTKNWPSTTKAKLVLTPHPAEAKRLWAGLGKSAWPKDRRSAALGLARKAGHIVVLKGAGTIVTDGSRIYVNKTGNPGMATAGSGDVLTGIIAALIGQGMGLFDASVFGVYLHGRAGDLAAEMIGQVSITARDLLDTLPDALREA